MSSLKLPKPVPNHSFLAEELLLPNTDKIDGSRTNMVCSQINQLLVLNNAEIPLVFSNFENQVGQYSTGIKFIKNDCRILKIFSFNEYRSLILVEYIETNTLDIIEYKHSINLTESFGYNNILNENVIEGNILSEGEIIHRNNMYDEEGNFKYGINLETVYLPYKGKTYEDPMVISESAAKKLSHSTVDKITIVLNRNDVLVKPLPKVGESVVDKLLTLRRRISLSSILSEFKNDNFAATLPEDVPFFASGMVTNIEVFCNTKEDLEFPYNTLLKEVEATQAALYSELVTFLDSVENDYHFADDVYFWKRKAVDYLDDEIFFTFDKSKFEGIVVMVELTDEKPCMVGSKLTGRHGNKGVVSEIIKDNEMPCTEDGRYAEVVCNALGTIGRLNPSQLYEQELNFIVSEIRLAAKNYKVFKKNILDFYSKVSPVYFEFITSLDELDELLKSAYATGDIFIHQPPFFENITPEVMIEVYNDFNIQKLKFKDIHEPLILGKLYFLKLKHEPMKKFSARSAGTTNLLDVPYKTNERQKKGNALYNTNPVRMGKFVCPYKTFLIAGNS